MPVKPLSIETLSHEQVAKTIDHSLLRPELDIEAVPASCELARAYASPRPVSSPATSCPLESCSRART
jgi:hypothetical protein